MKILKSIFSGRCCDCGAPATVLVESAGYQYKICNTCLGEWEEERNQPKEEGEYLVIFESDRTKYKGLESYYPDTKEWSTICKIIAWKEIVLPELKESE